MASVGQLLLMLLGAGLLWSVWPGAVALNGARRAMAMPPGGDTVVVFGPHTFATPTGAETFHVQAFVATPTPGRRYTMLFDRDTLTLTQATFKLNGALVIGLGGLLEQPSGTVASVVQLLASDTVTANIQGTAGANVRVRIVSVPDPTYTVRGPTTYNGIPNNPGYVNDTFALAVPPAAAPYYLYVTNGPAGSTPITGLTIYVNGGSNVTPAGFNAQSKGFVRKILAANNGQNVLRVRATGPTGSAIQIRLVATDNIAPKMTVTAPTSGSVTSATSVMVTGMVIDSTPAGVSVNGVTATMSGTTFSASVPLSSEGANVLTIRAVDGAELQTDSVRTVTRDTQAPTLAVTVPVDGLVTKQDSVTFAGTVSDATALTVNVNGVPVTVTSGAFSKAFALVSGANVFSVAATDAASNVTTVVRTVTQDKVAPTLVVTAPNEGATTPADSLVVSGTVTDASAVTVAANGVALPVVSGVFSGKVALLLGANVIAVQATDAATNVVTITRNVTRQSSIALNGPLPVDPSVNAPALDPTKPATMLAATSFLYSGANPIQTGVLPGTIILERAAVVRGRILTQGGSPLAGVAVTIADHPEYGTTTTRANGLYDLAVNGGSPLRVRLSKSGYLPSERLVNTSWQSYAVSEDVVLMALDVQSTVINFAAPIEVAQGSVVSDSRGTRQAAAMFEQGTLATLVLPNGTTQPASSLTVRATEYTVGSTGPNAMPGQLPPTSAYTYAVELSADEAIAAGAKEIQFSKPVAIYVDNFIGFKTGLAVPAGYFDRSRGVWVPMEDGRVIEIVGITNGRADVAIDTSRIAADSATLTTFGFTNTERQELAQRYAVGKTLWRVEVAHFTPIDLNWFLRLFNPLEDPLQQPKKNLDRCESTEGGSIIGCENQTLGETIGLPGSGGYSLNFQSERTPGYRQRQQLVLRLLGDTVPSTLEEINVTATIAGRNLNWSLPQAQLAQRLTLRADLSALLQGTDPYGRAITSGTYLVSGTVKYVYRGQYGANGPGTAQRTFARPGLESITGAVCDTTVSGCRPRLEVTEPFFSEIRTWDVRQTHGLGGWTLSPHHAYDPVGGELLMGDGTRRTVNEMGLITRTVAGSGSDLVTGDGGLATSAGLGQATSIVLNSAGHLFLDGYSANRVRRVANGTITAFGPTIPRPQNLAIGPDQSIYVSTQDHRVLRLNAVTGDTAAVAGGGLDFTTDGINAVGQARLFGITGLAIGPDGSIYIASFHTLTVRRVMPDGRIYTVAGTGQGCGLGSSGGDGQPAIQVKICYPVGIAVSPTGVLYILDRQYLGTVLRRVGLDGLIGTAVGTVTACPNSNSPCGDGGLASQAGLSPNTQSVSMSRDGTVLLADLEKIRAIDPSGRISTVFGSASPAASYGGDGKPPLLTVFYWPVDAETGPDGQLYVLDQLSYRVVRGVPPVPLAPSQNVLIASEDGEEVYVFDPSGRHLQTIDALTRHVINNFSYDAPGRLLSVTDSDGNVTSIERNGSGNPTAVAGPFGQRNTLSLDTRGYLTSVTNPANEVTQAQHDTTGLLVTMTDPKNNPPHVFTYDSLGRLTKDENAAGGYKTLARLDTDSTFGGSVTTRMGRTSTYMVQYLADGSINRKETDAAGLVTTLTERANRVSTQALPDGSVINVTEGADPRFGFQSSLMSAFSIKMPTGLEASGRVARSTVLSNLADPLSLVSQTDSLIVNGRIATATFTAATRTRNYTSAQGRQFSTVLDSLGRVVESRAPGVAMTRSTYGARGFLTSTSQAGRIFLYSYDSSGRVIRTQDPLGRVDQYAYDSAGRVVRQTLSNNRMIQYGYDVNGNLTSLTPPSRPAHTFAFTATNDPGTFAPPAAGLATPATTFSYNNDQQLIQIIRPDSITIGVGYDAAGRQNALTTPTGTLGMTYSTAGLLSSLTAPQGGSLSLTYDGSLVKSITLGGTVAGAVGYAYDSNFRMSALSVNGANSIAFAYDNDNLLTSAGSLVLSRNAATGRLTGTTLGSVATGVTYDDSVGAVTQLTAAHASTPLFDAQYTRDSLDRVTTLVETIQGVSRTLSYSYDSLGRVDQVRVGGTLTADYQYDDNGNRTSLTTQSGTILGTTDDQDRLLSYGSASYAYSANGELRRKIVGVDTTRYTYDVLGNLLQVRFQSGQFIDYIVDGLNRRIGRKVNGSLTQGFLYQGQLAPIAELNASNQVVSRFVYATRNNVPDYVIRGGTTYRLVLDQLGSVRLVVAVSTGTVAQRLDYDEYGQITQNTNPGFQPFGYAGGLYDNDSKLVRFGARDYDAETGRWLAKDPIDFAGGSSNLFAYAHEDPVNLVDSDGLQAVIPVGGPFLPPLYFPPPVIPWDDHTDWSGWADDLWEDFIDGPIPIDDAIAWCSKQRGKLGKRLSDFGEKRKRGADREQAHKPPKQSGGKAGRDRHTRSHSSKDPLRNPNTAGNPRPQKPPAPKAPMPNKGPKKKP